MKIKFDVSTSLKEKKEIDTIILNQLKINPNEINLLNIVLHLDNQEITNKKTFYNYIVKLAKHNNIKLNEIKELEIEEIENEIISINNKEYLEQLRKVPESFLDEKSKSFLIKYQREYNLNNSSGDKKTNDKLFYILQNIKNDIYIKLIQNDKFINSVVKELKELSFTEKYSNQNFNIKLSNIDIEKEFKDEIKKIKSEYGNKDSLSDTEQYELEKRIDKFSKSMFIQKRLEEILKLSKKLPKLTDEQKVLAYSDIITTMNYLNPKENYILKFIDNEEEIKRVSLLKKVRDIIFNLNQKLIPYGLKDIFPLKAFREDIEDFIQEGNLKLISDIDSYNIYKNNFSFSSYFLNFLTSKLIREHKESSLFKIPYSKMDQLNKISKKLFDTDIKEFIEKLYIETTEGDTYKTTFDDSAKGSFKLSNIKNEELRMKLAEDFLLENIVKENGLCNLKTYNQVKNFSDYEVIPLNDNNEEENFYEYDLIENDYSYIDKEEENYFSYISTNSEVLNEEIIFADSNSQYNMLFKEEMCNILDSVLEKLSDKEQMIIRMRFGLIENDSGERTLEEIGKEFQISRERIRQIESSAIKKIRHPRNNSLKNICLFN